jgi:hypothetical protein
LGPDVGSDTTALVATPGAQIDIAATGQAVRGALEQAGARPQAVTLSIVDRIPAGAAGKRPLVVADRTATPHGVP